MAPRKTRTKAAVDNTRSKKGKDHVEYAQMKASSDALWEFLCVLSFVNSFSQPLGFPTLNLAVSRLCDLNSLR
jgi:hypothetical protein